MNEFCSLLTLVHISPPEVNTCMQEAHIKIKFDFFIVHICKSTSAAAIVYDLNAKTDSILRLQETPFIFWFHNYRSSLFHDHQSINSEIIFFTFFTNLLLKFLMKGKNTDREAHGFPLIFKSMNRASKAPKGRPCLDFACQKWP